MLILRRHLPDLVLALAVALAVAFAARHIALGDVIVYHDGGRAAFRPGLYSFRVGADGFTYPPIAAELFASIAWLPVPVMFVILTSASAAALYVVLRRSLPRAELTTRAAARVAPLVLTAPVIAIFERGQVDLVLVALVLHDLLVRRRGVLVGLAAALKLTPLVFVLYLLLCGRWREARNAVVTFLGVGAVGAVLSPAASWRYWTHDALAGSGVGGFEQTNNQSLRGLAERMLGTGAGTTVWLVLAGPVLLAGLVLARRVFRGGNDLLGAGIAGIAGCCVSPVSWLHAWVWCIPCIAALPAVPLVILGLLFVSPFHAGRVVGAGYPVVAVIACAVGWRRARDGRAATQSVRPESSRSAREDPADRAPAPLPAQRR